MRETMSKKRDIAIIGLGVTKFGELFNQSYDDLVRDAAMQAVNDAGIGLDEVGGAWLSTAFPEIGVFKGRSGMDLVEPLNLYGIPVTRVSNFCASGADSIRNAANALAAGECDIAMALGVEKLRDRSPQDSIVKMMVELSHPYYQKGFTAAGTFAIYAKRIMHEYGVTREDIANTSVKNHYHGTLNDKAHHRVSCSMEQVLGSPMVADPLTVMDSCPTTDGAACVIMVRAEDVDKTKHNPVYVDGIGLSVSTGLLSCGHPVGATGVRMVVEVANHLRGNAGDRQVEGAKKGISHNIGGPGAIASVIVLNKEN